MTTDAATRVLTFELTQGDTVAVQLSSYMNDVRPAHVRPRLVDRRVLPRPPPASLGDSIVAGLTWAFTPWTNLQLVYAVQKPLLVPVLADMYADKVLESDLRDLGGDITYSPKSTAHTDLLAQWDDPVDNGPGSATPQGPGVPAPNDQPVARQSTVSRSRARSSRRLREQDRFLGRHEFFDTKHRFVNYTGKATSVFTEHYQGSSTFAVPSPGTATALDLAGPHRARPRGRLGDRDGRDGTPTRRTPTSRSTSSPARSRSRRHRRAAGQRDGDGHVPAAGQRRDDPHTLNILSSARPLSPDVEFIVPIFKWSKVTPSRRQDVQRPHAAGLRVFLPPVVELRDR